ncbi:hypothetical protein AX14_005201 [Amanita brunnescens Koide BX004]|nr:hypothetical protein AX14_005201 [Amanita brunnescens Koide BX004]
MDGSGRGVRLTVSNQTEKGLKTDQIKTNGVPSFKASLTALWGPRAMENTVELDVSFHVQQEKSALRRIRDRHQEAQGSQTQGSSQDDDETIPIQVKGLISKFSVGAGRTGTDRQFFYVNGRPCNLTKVQKAFNEVYRTFNANQTPFILADFMVPTECCDINVSPDKRTIFLQSEGKLIDALKAALETEFSSHRSTFDLNQTQLSQRALTQTTFDSPFSKRLNLKTGAGLMKSQSLPVPASSKEKERLPEPVREAGEALSLPEPGEHDEAQAAASDGRELSTGEADAESEIIKSAERTDIREVTPCPEKSVHMDINERGGPERGVGEEKETEKPIVLDTTQAIWGRKEAETTSEKRAGREHDSVSEEPAMKKGMESEDAKAKESTSASKPTRKPPSKSTVSEKRASSIPRAHDGVSEEPATKKGVELGDAEDKDSTSASKPTRKPPSKSTVSEKRAGSLPGEDGGDSEEPATKKRRVELGDAEAQDSMSASKPTCKPLSKSTVSEKWGGNVPREHGGDPVEPGTKKRRVDLGDSRAEASTSASKPTRKPPSKSGVNTTSLDSLRSRLAAFARGGIKSSKQVPRAADEGTEDEEGISIKTSGTAARKRRDGSPGFEVIRPAIKTSVLRMEARSAGNVNKTRGGSDGDTVMDDVAPSTSSTIEVAVRHSGSKVIESDDEQDATSKTSGKQVGHRPEIIRGIDTASGNMTMRFNLERLSSAWTRPRKGQELNARDAPCTSSKVSADAGVANMEDNESATHALARVIDKADFANMDIVGQFNLGFIIVRRQKAMCDEGAQNGQMDDLFIVDQHASDEKYNFETLQQTTRIQSQKLFRPRSLELTAADELVAIENMDLLQQNGFELQVDEAAAAGQGTKLKVTAIPVSKSTEFGMTDLEELINLMRDQPSGNVVRCSKARAMFAMRACRKSVMIGMSLNKNQMATVVQHMGMIDQPWNCPHGRPTMRHLFDLCQDSLKRQSRRIDWSSLEGA